MPSVFIKTYGCQMNERDSEWVAAQLVAHGYSLAASEGTADVVLLNTCSVRDAAEQKAVGKMQSLSAEIRRRDPKVVLGFLGCMAQARGQSLLDQLASVKLVLGTRQYHRAPEYVERLLTDRGQRICDISETPPSVAPPQAHLAMRDSQPPAVTAFVNIMQGCNQYCTFCIVPYTRGEEQSRPLEDIVGEIRTLAANGVKEVTLLGQIVTSYGRRELGVRNGKSGFVQLLDAVQQVEGLERIRFTAPHPKGYGDDLVEAYGRIPKLCESAHLPVQSGSDRILRLMHRGYTVERYLDLISKLRAVQPGIGLTTDLIVGFPGETQADFDDTLALVRQAQFDNAFLFKYSPRQGTPAASLPDQVPQTVKEERHAQLLKCLNEVGSQRYQRLVGQQVQVLVEGPSRKNSARFTGRSRCNKIVVFPGDDRTRGQLLHARVTRTGTFTLYADPALINLE